MFITHSVTKDRSEVLFDRLAIKKFEYRTSYSFARKMGIYLSPPTERKVTLKKGEFYFSYEYTTRRIS